MISSLKKLKGRSLAEFAERGRQTVSSFAERLGVSKETRLLDDASLLTLFQGKDLKGIEDLRDHFRCRKSFFYPSFLDPKCTISTFLNNFADEEAELLTQAERICSGKFDLLGYADLDFGSPIPDWFLEPVSGRRSPRIHRSRIKELDPTLSGDKKIVWELNRHQYFTILGRAYWLTQDERFAETFVTHVRDWIANNPPKIGLNWRSSLELAFRSISWIWAYHFFRDSPVLSTALFGEMLSVLYLNGRHIERHLSTFSSPNTHLTGEALGLYALGNLFHGTEAGARWLARGREVLLTALKFQFRGDGGYVEQATQYHRYSADFYLTFLIWETAAGQVTESETYQAVRRLLAFLTHITQPDGRTPLIGDDDGGRLHFLDGREFSDLRSTLALGALLLDDPAMRFAAGPPSEELLWLAGTDGLERYGMIEGAEPAAKAYGFTESGFFTGRSGWQKDSSFILIKCGEHGFLNGAHAHADALSFILTVRGTPVFVDSGTYTYTADSKARDRYRSTAAHNCALANGRSSSTPDGPFTWKTKANSKLLEWTANEHSIVFRGTHDGFEDIGIRYIREIAVAGWSSMKLIDRFETFSNNQFNINFILSPEVEAELVDQARLVVRQKGDKKALVMVGTTVSIEGFGSRWMIEPAKISPRYGLEVDTKRLIYPVTADRAFDIQTILEFV